MLKEPSLLKEASPRKHTLKTFPAPIPGYESYDRLQRWIDKACDWHKEFEQELRDFKDILEHYGEDQKNPHRLLEKIVEILGDETP
jgi:hypothetical protein